MKVISFSDARAHLSETLHQLEAEQGPLLISRRGKSAAVLLSLAQYGQLMNAEQGFSARLAQWRTDHAQDLSAEEPLTPLRDSTHGRDFSW